ncbi:MAG: YggT family protein [Betaproteobacteria bacterium]|nr:YggT family protein [Betaproteobacteria bacterium]
MLIDALQFLLRVLLGLAASAFWLRFYMQWARVPFHNPFAQFIVKVTDFAVRPLRRVIPGLLGLDWASLLLCYLAELLITLGSLWLVSYPFAVAGWAVVPGFLLHALAMLLQLALYILMGLIFLQAILSWVNPFSPLAPVFHALVRPVLAPLQRLIPNIAGIDVSPIAAFIVIQLLLITVVSGLERHATGLIW